MGRENAEVRQGTTVVSSDDIHRTAWSIAAKHLTEGQKDVTKMIVEGMLQERVRCVELMSSALGPDDPRAVFLAHPEAEWR